MTRFVLLIRDDATGSSFTLTGGGATLDAAAQAVTAYGGSIVADGHYVVAGAYDSVLVVDFPDEAGLIGFGHALGSWGQYVEALRCYTRDDLDRAKDLAAKATESVRTQFTSVKESLESEPPT